MYDLSTLKGIKVKPVAPNLLLPSLGGNNMDSAFDETLNKYGK
jgi:hypothetical protein